MATALEEKHGDSYTYVGLDIRDRPAVEEPLRPYGGDIELVVHTAAQPSHDWAAHYPFTDFDVNAVGTLNIIENTRQHCPGAVFIFTSTNKVFGETRVEPPGLLAHDRMLTAMRDAAITVVPSLWRVGVARR